MTEHARLKLLDLFCGMGGWSIGFHREGFRCYGLDEVDVGYPYEFWQTPIEEFRGGEYRDMGFDVVVASPPCTEFSDMSRLAHVVGNRQSPPDPEKGMRLVREGKRVIDLVQPKFWLIENVKGALKPFYPVLGGPRMKIGPWQLWGNYPKFMLPQSNGWKKGMTRSQSGFDPLIAWKQARIPLPLSLALAKACKEALERDHTNTSRSER